MRAFTLLELVFVIVIISILSAVGAYYMKPNYLRNDTNFVLMKIKDVKYKAIGYSKELPGLGDINYSVGCIDINDLNDTENSHYKFHSTISVSPSMNTLCFDQYGRLHKDNNTSSLSSILNKNVIITLTYNSKNSTIKIYPISGFVEAK